MNIKTTTTTCVSNSSSFYCDYNNSLQIGCEDGSEIIIGLNEDQFAQLKATIDVRHERNEEKRIQKLKEELEELEGERSINIVVQGGCVVDVEGLPCGCDYNIKDLDTDPSS